MFTYRFKMGFEESETFSRDIELKSDQTFWDFYTIIANNLALDQEKPASFYLSDHRYRKHREIVRPMDLSESEQPNTEAPKKLIMDQCTLSDYIDDPHQRFLFVFDPDKEWNFFIELFKISPSNKEEEYPRVAASKGPIPRELRKKVIDVQKANQKEAELEDDNDFDPPQLEDHPEREDELLDTDEFDQIDNSRMDNPDSEINSNHEGK